MAYRTIKFRDVFWQVLTRFGFEPEFEQMPKNETYAVGRYIDQWVTKLFPATDWPEWTLTAQVEPDPTTHIVPYDGPSFTVSGGALNRFWRVHNVYLVDPTTTSSPVGTKYYLKDNGIHCGYDHGTSVWIKYNEPPPRFTTVEWDSGTIYNAGDVTYSPVTGECYKSKVNNNQNHDPSVTLGGPQPNIAVSQSQQVAVAQLGALAQDKILQVVFPPASPDPPAGSAPFRITVNDVNGNVIYSAFENGDGVKSLATIINALVTDLTGGLGAGWTVTANTSVTPFYIRVENASDFYFGNTVHGTDFPFFAIDSGHPLIPLDIVQIQPYIASGTGSTITPAIMTATFSAEQLIAGALYNLSFKDLSGFEHVVQYQSLESDGKDQITAGILNAMATAGTNDSFVSMISTSLDPATPAITFTSNLQVSLDATLQLPGSPWWSFVGFPLALYEQVVTGAYADLLKDWGQTDKGIQEEGQVPTEQDIATARLTYEPILPLTSQSRPMSRYK